MIRGMIRERNGRRNIFSFKRLFNRSVLDFSQLFVKRKEKNKKKKRETESLIAPKKEKKKRKSQVLENAGL